MKNSLLFLGCNHDQIPYLNFIKKKLDWKIVGVDLDKKAPGKFLCDKFYNVGYDDLKGLVKIGKIEKFTKHDMVFTAAAQFAQKGAAHFSAHFGIKYPSEKSIDLCLDKTKYYDYFFKNKIPIPKTWKIKNEDDIKDKIKLSNSKYFYLKSDFSKNPNYVYRFNKSNIPWHNFFWGKDRFLRKYYVLQEEVKGTSLRINIYGQRFNVFEFSNGKKTLNYHKDIYDIKIIQTLKKLMIKQGIQNWLVKFDIILSKKKYVVLDIGIDPPSRMLKNSRKNKIDFVKYYLTQYLDGKVEYPQILD